MFRKELKETESLNIKEITITDESYSIKDFTVSFQLEDQKNLEVISYYVIKDEFSNQRVGNARVKRRGEVRGGGKKPWKQKGTGKARQGSIRAIQWPGGGKAFGPNGRIYDKKINKKLLSKFMNLVFTNKIKNEELFVLNNQCTKTKITIKYLNDFLFNHSGKAFEKKKCFVYDDENNIKTIHNFEKEKNNLVNIDKMLCRDIFYTKFIFFLNKSTLNQFISEYITKETK